MIEEELKHRFFRDPRVKGVLPALEREVAAAVRRVFAAFTGDPPESGTGTG